MTKWEEILEDAIIGKIVSTLINDGFRVEVSDQDGGGLHIYAAPDGGDMPEGGYKHWVRLTLGNGADIISDCSTNLEAILKPAEDFARQYQD